MQAHTSHFSAFTDEQLAVRACQADDELAFEELKVRYDRLVIAVCYRVLASNKSYVEEAAQETWIKAWRNRCRFDPTIGVGRYRSWLIRIAKNESNTILRHLKRKPALTGESLDNADGVELEPYELMHLRELEGATAACIDRLPPKQKCVIKADQEPGKSDAGIASICGGTPGSVRVSRNAARQSIEECLLHKGFEL